MDDLEKKGLVILALLVIGCGIGRQSVEPVEVLPTETITKETRIEVPVPGPTETVYVDRVPEACINMANLAKETNTRTVSLLNLGTSFLDAMEDARRGIAGSQSDMITDADNQVRRIQSRTLDFLPTADLGGNPLKAAIKECEAELP